MGLSKTSIFLIFAAIIAFVSGVVGFSLENPYWIKPNDPEDINRYDLLGGALWVLYTTAKLFVLEGPEYVPTNLDATLSQNLINVARILAPISFAGALVTAFVNFWHPQYNYLKARLARNHIIIFGGGPYAQEFLKNLQNEEYKVLSLSSTIEQKAAIQERFGDRIYPHLSMPDNSSVWTSLAISKARSIILLDECDHLNLSAANTIVQLSNQNRVQSPRVFCHISDYKLRNELVGQTDAFESSNFTRIEPFSCSELGARNFFHQNDFFWETTKRNQDRIHWLVVGMSEASFTLLSHFMKISPCPSLTHPKFTVVAPTNNKLFRELSDLVSGCAGLAEIEVYDPLDFEKHLRAGEVIGEISDPITAILFAGNAESSLEAALQIRRISSRDTLLRAPIYFSDYDGTTNLSGIWSQLSNHMHDKIDWISNPDDICTLQSLQGQLDKTARTLHSNYLSALKVRDQQTIPSHRSWDSLGESFRRANRRAADHAKTKFESLNVLGNFDLTNLPESMHEHLDSITIEKLSKVEHQSWMIDRLQGGWKFAEVRDDRKRFHPNIAPYRELTEDVKELDREQIRSLTRPKKGLQQDSSMRPVLSVGLIGRNQLDETEALHIYKSLREKILPELCQKYPGHELRFFSPLAPGSDLIACQSMEDYFKTANQLHQLYVITCAGIDEIVAAYLDQATDKRCWTLDENLKPKCTKPAHEIVKTLETFSSRYKHIDICNVRASTLTERLAINSEYIATRMDVLVAYLGDSSKNGPSGTIETVELASKNEIPTIAI